MKRFFAWILAAVLVLALAGCGGGETPASSEASSASSQSSASSEVASEPASESQADTEGDYPATVPDVTVTDVLITPPEGFTQAEDGSLVYTAADGSNIQVQYQEIATAGMSTAFEPDEMAAGLEEQLETQFAQMLGQEVDVTVADCSQALIDGMPGMRVVIDYELTGVAVHQISYTISADGVYTFTFTQMGDADWSDAFETCAQSIDFVTE
jgi:hypothetical protein